MEEQIKGAEPLANERHELFCQKYIANPKLKISEAGLEAGYENRQNAWDVFKRQDVQDRISYLNLERMADLRVDQYLVIKNLRDVAEKAIEEGEYSAANKANELLGKHMNMFTDKVQHEHSGKVDIKKLADDDLDKRIKELENKVMQNDKRGEA
ncbi:terminase small subunit [Acinetobacter seifertii]|uniref:terminase small subunit n=1 Tax=Acinetobacter seifertii TaxID=1530123 RepID=UPI00168AA189|nr:terminase small subunit [Acinetobacter seifertii]MDB0279928.1 terminase small subunit [Acinetobacter seifertii]QNX13375.1 terminase small subunit [Acinetobacter seifertii]QNX13426.1 terminase small subunit [Acinetobacter seifertii]QNX46373.1 terminase small subunit [Acinetobacter seifertii]QNX53551.1 terminase small subunit [Acinetobacter seifertii]